MTTIIEVLESADYSIQHNKVSQNPIAVAAQLHNAVTLLEKGYDLYDDFDEIASVYAAAEDVPDKEER